MCQLWPECEQEPSKRAEKVEVRQDEKKAARVFRGLWPRLSGNFALLPYQGKAGVALTKLGAVLN